MTRPRQGLDVPQGLDAPHFLREHGVYSYKQSLYKQSLDALQALDDGGHDRGRATL